MEPKPTGAVATAPEAMAEPQLPRAPPELSYGPVGSMGESERSIDPHKAHAVVVVLMQYEYC